MIKPIACDIIPHSPPKAKNLRFYSGKGLVRVRMRLCVRVCALAGACAHTVDMVHGSSTFMAQEQRWSSFPLKCRKNVILIA